MKKLALLSSALFGLSLAFFATAEASPQDDQKFAFARASCAANKVAPSGPQYSDCIDAFRVAIPMTNPLVAPQVVRQLRQAAADCTAHNVPRADPNWGQCVNTYLESYYRYQITRFPDGRLHRMRMPSPSAVFHLRPILPLS